jgi:hypothetical protein
MIEELEPNLLKKNIPWFRQSTIPFRMMIELTIVLEWRPQVRFQDETQLNRNDSGSVYGSRQGAEWGGQCVRVRVKRGDLVVMGKKGFEKEKKGY